METAAILLLGLVIGTAAGWFFRSSRARSEIENTRLGSGPDLALMQQRAEQAEGQLRETQQRLGEVERQKEAAIEQLREESSRRASFETLSARIPSMQKELQDRDQS